MKKQVAIPRAIALAAILLCGPLLADGVNYPDVLKAIGRDIDAIKHVYPQLKDFSVSVNVDVDSLQISYGYRTHQSEGGAGWTAGVPNPDDEGVWFYIDFHDANSERQIHTQPKTFLPECLGDMRISFLSLEGARTKSLDGAFWKIFRAHGVKRCSH